MAVRASRSPPAPSPIQRKNLPDEVAVLLRDMIVQDELAPGTHIQEAALCERFGISRTPLREAIRILVAEGLVTPLPRRGAIVATPTPEEIQGLFFALGALESVCAPLACENLTAAEIGAIERQHATMVAHYKRGQMKSYYRANQAIHQSIVSAARNSFLADLHGSLSLRILRARYFIAMPNSSWSRALREHQEMLALIRARDGRRLAELMLRHMLGSWRDFELMLGRPRLARSGT